MSTEDSIKRLVETATPSVKLRAAAKQHIMRRIQPQALLSSVESTTISDTSASNVRRRILRAIRPEAADTLSSLAHDTQVTSRVFSRIRESVLSRLEAPQQTSFWHSGFKWGAAFAVFVLIIRSMPLILLAPPTSAETGVQLLPAGEQVTVFIGGVWQPVTGPRRLDGPAMISTGDSHATVILNDDGVFRLSPHTTLKIQDVTDHPHGSSNGITATLVRGELWTLGLLPPILEGLELETAQGILSLNAGSASVSQQEDRVTVAVYDKGVTFTTSDRTTFLVSGEKTIVSNAGTSGIISMPVRAYADPWVSEHLSQDAVHRADIAQLQDERRAEIAGILPTSFLYPAKRIAEEVDVLFTLTQAGRTEKRVEQASTRLSEALALMKQGDTAAASEPLTEYSQTLVALASDEEDNLVKDLIRQQIAEAGASIATPSKDPETSLTMLTDAVSKIGAVIPDARLSPIDIQGYVLVDKLAEINKILSLDHDAQSAANAYSEIRPYLTDLLAKETGANPLLQREAMALLVSISSLLKDSEAATAANPKLVAAMLDDVTKYLPEEQQSIEELNAELDAKVQVIRGMILKFDSPISRYNELMHQMDVIISNTSDPNRGLLLRKLKQALPVALGEYVNLGIKRLGDELRQ